VRTAHLTASSKKFLLPSSFHPLNPDRLVVAELPSSYGSQKSGMKVLVKLRVN
jgi:hypothetical protein